jgi:hypothetical protein
MAGSGGVWFSGTFYGKWAYQLPAMGHGGQMLQKIMQ